MGHMYHVDRSPLDHQPRRNLSSCRRHWICSALQDPGIKPRNFLCLLLSAPRFPRSRPHLAYPTDRRLLCMRHAEVVILIEPFFTGFSKRTCGGNHSSVTLLSYLYFPEVCFQTTIKHVLLSRKQTYTTGKITLCFCLSQIWSCFILTLGVTGSRLLAVVFCFVQWEAVPHRVLLFVTADSV